MTAITAPAEASTALPTRLPTRRPLGHLGEMAKDPLHLFLRTRRECGDLGIVRLGPVDIWLAQHPDHVEHVLLRNAGNFTKDTRGYDLLADLIGNGLVTAQGATWKRQRRIVNPAFHRKCLQGFTVEMQKSAESLSERWLAQTSSGPAELDMGHEMMTVTLEIACRSFFSSELAHETAIVGRSVDTAMHRFTELLNNLLPGARTLPTKRNRELWRALRELDEVVFRIVADRRADANPRPDLLSMLLDASDDEGGGMSDQELRDQLVTMLAAGHETTGNALTWTLHLLALHPVWAKRVAEELDSVLGGRTPGMEDLAALELTGRVLDESMRLLPPVWIVGRQTAEADELGGFHVPANTFVYLTPYGTHRHPDFWRNPEAFDPDRFLPERVKQRHKYAFLPFSAGSRKCIGDRFARLEAMIVLARVLQDVSVETVSGFKVEIEPSVTLRPKHGLRMMVRKR
ncbi:MAG: cytochrome P450 [Proteobacteria bacterium]|nr:cytochrome P450 [Pseudomonadota bacterium]